MPVDDPFQLVPLTYRSSVLYWSFAIFVFAFSSHSYSRAKSCLDSCPGSILTCVLSLDSDIVNFRFYFHLRSDNRDERHRHENFSSYTVRRNVTSYRVSHFEEVRIDGFATAFENTAHRLITEIVSSEVTSSQRQSSTLDKSFDERR